MKLFSKIKLPHRKNYKFIEIFKVKGVPIKVHYTLFIGLLIAMLLGAFSHSHYFLIAAPALFLIMLAHELGHMWFAKRLGVKTYRIELYLFYGFCINEEAYTQYENDIISWGGVAGQALIFIPAFLTLTFLAPYLLESINTFLAFLGPYNLLIAALNLIPVAPLDGATCWRTVPVLLRSRLKKKTKKNKKKKSPLKIVK